MALQGSGAISLSQIKTELNSSSNSLRTLSAAAGKSTPDAMSEFYGYTGALLTYPGKTNAGTASDPITVPVYLYFDQYMLDLVGSLDWRGGASFTIQASGNYRFRANYTIPVAGGDATTSCWYIGGGPYTYNRVCKMPSQGVTGLKVLATEYRNVSPGDTVGVGSDAASYCCRNNSTGQMFPTYVQQGGNPYEGWNADVAPLVASATVWLE